MDISILKTRIDALKKLFSDPIQDTIGFRELIILRYSQSVLNELEKIIYDKKNSGELSGNLQNFLSKNWEFVKGNLLCYTALPRHDITELLCDIAEWIAESKLEHGGPLTAINILMPTVHCDSLDPKLYPNLDEIDLKKVIQTHILGENHHYLVPISLLIKGEKGENRPYLVLISLLNRVKKNEDEPNAKISNPYFDVFFHEENSALSPVFLNDKEIERLFTHSDATKAMANAIRHYQFSINESSLFKQLQILIRGLELNSIRGMGKEESAAIGGYNALIAFMDFWHLLSNKLDTIPPALVKEINFIQQLTTDPEQNTKYRIETCLATRRDELFKKIACHEEILNTITLSDEKKGNLTTEYLQQLKRSVDNLASHLQNGRNGSYVGQDQLGITTAVFTALKIPLNLFNYETVALVLKKVALEEVPAFCALKEVREKMIAIFSSLDDFILLSDLLNNTLFALFLHALRQQFQEQIQSSRHLLMALNHINPNHYVAVYEALQEKLPLIVKDAYGFSAILKVLSSYRRTTMYQAFKKSFVRMIHNTEDFLTLYLSLEPTQQTILYQSLQGHWQSIIQTNHEFYRIFSHLSTEKKAMLYESFQERLTWLIKDSNDFLTLYSALESIQQIALCIALKNHWRSILKTASEFSKLLRYLSPIQKIALYDAFKTQLPLLIKNKNDFLSVYSGLESNQQIALCRSLQEHWHSIIKAADEFAEIIFYLSAEQKIILYDTFKAQLPALVKHSKDFRILISYLDYSQCTNLCCSLKEHWSSIIKNTSDLCALFKHLPFEKYGAERIWICTSLKGAQWSNIINNAVNLSRLLIYLQPTEQVLVFASLQTHWDSILKNPEDFNQVISSLEADERSILCGYLEAHWPSLIKNPRDFIQIFYTLEFHQRAALCESFQTHWPTIIKTTEHLYLLNHLTQTERKRVCVSLAEHWSSLIKNINDFQCVASYLDTDQFANLCTALKERWSCLIKNKSDLEIVLCSIDTLKKEILLHALKEPLPITKNLDKPSQTVHCSVPKPSTSKLFSRIFQPEKRHYFDQLFYSAPRP